jgi:hypothetical protein
MNILRIYKEFFVSKIIGLFKGRPFYLKTPIDYLILLFKTSGLLPSNVIAIELFGMYGVYLTKHYARYCETVDMWEIDPKYVYYANKFKERNVTVIQGDSVSSVQNGLIQKQYNLLIVDNPLVSPYGDGLIEHFNVMPSVFKIAKEKFIIIFNVILTDPAVLYERYNLNAEVHVKNRQFWVQERKKFYENTDGIHIPPQKYLEIYAQKFDQWGMEVQFSTFLPRDERVGFLAFALKKKS